MNRNFLFFTKKIDFSIFNYGTAIPKDYHKQIDIFLGFNLKKGDKHNVIISLFNKNYDGLIMIPKNKSLTPQYQLRYKDKKLLSLIENIFSESFQYIKNQKEDNILIGKKRSQIETIYEDFLNIFFDKTTNTILFKPQLDPNVYSKSKLSLIEKLNIL